MGALLIHKQDPGARVTQAIFQLWPGPPGIQRHHNCAADRGGPEADGPLGKIAHGNGHPVTLLNAVFVHQQVCQFTDITMHLGVGQALIFIHQVGSVSKSLSTCKNFCQVAWGIFPGPQTDTANLPGLHFKWRTGCCQQRRCSGNRQLTHDWVPLWLLCVDAVCRFRNTASWLMARRPSGIRAANSWKTWGMCGHRVKTMSPP